MLDNTAHTREAVKTFDGLATKYLAESHISDGEAPIEAVDSYRDASANVQAIQRVATDLDAKLAKLDEERPLMTITAHKHYREQAIEAAKTQVEVAQRSFSQAQEAAEAHLLDSALPKLSSDSREALARQELEVAIGDASGNAVAARVLGIAKTGSPEVQAALGTPYARTLLIARGTEGVDRILREAQVVVAETGTTPEAVKARAARERLDDLGAARTAALSAFRHASRQ